jgi:5-methylcytosine-specific restriction endonuclease McrA
MDDFPNLGNEIFGARECHSTSTPLSRWVEYSTYMESPAWKAKRLLALERDKHRCVFCNASKRLEVHHREYKRLGDEYPEDIYTLCHRCHVKHHTKDPEAN